MTFKTLKTGTRIAGAATDSYTTSAAIHGEIKAIEVFVSASTDFKVYTLDEAGAAWEYLLGASGSTVTTAASKKYYTKVLEQKMSDGTDLTTYTNAVINNKIKIDASNLTAADTWSVNIIYEDNY